MKKKAIIAIASLLAFGQGAWAEDVVWPTTIGSMTLNNETANKYYPVSSVDNLNDLAVYVNGQGTYSTGGEETTAHTCQGLTFKLTAEDGLDYTDKTFTPIGYGDNNDGKPFSGTFDGNGKTISGITVDMPEGWGVGLFGYISKATIKDVTITSSSFTANGFVGAIAGSSAGVNNHASPIIDNCHVTNTVSVTATDYGAGGIIGIDNDNLTIKDCTSAATITSTDAGIGGIIGVAYEDSYMVTITDSYYLGNLSAIGENGDHNDEIEKYATINITLLNDDRNATVKNSKRIANYNGETANVTISSRTLIKDGYWNTLCLPFDVDLTASGCPLSGDGVSAMTLDTSSSNLTDNTLTLEFSATASITAGTPFIIKWDNTGATPTGLVFTDKTIKKASNNTSVGEHVTFTGTYSPVVIGAGGDNTKLYLGGDDTLYYPNDDMTIGAFRAYFQLNGITAGEPQNPGGGGNLARNIVLNFADDATGIGATLMSSEKVNSEAWHSLDGRKLNSKPTQKGLYIYKGKKMVVK